MDCGYGRPTVDFGLWTLNYGLYTVEYTLWTVDGLCTVDCRPRTVDRELLTLDCEN